MDTCSLIPRPRPAWVAFGFLLAAVASCASARSPEGPRAGSGSASPSIAAIADQLVEEARVRAELSGLRVGVLELSESEPLGAARAATPSRRLGAARAASAAAPARRLGVALAGELTAALSRRLHLVDTSLEPAADPEALARQLGATHALTGSFVRRPEDVLVSVRLVSLDGRLILATARGGVPLSELTLAAPRATDATALAATDEGGAAATEDAATTSSTSAALALPSAPRGGGGQDSGNLARGGSDSTSDGRLGGSGRSSGSRALGGSASGSSDVALGGSGQTSGNRGPAARGAGGLSLPDEPARIPRRQEIGDARTASASTVTTQPTAASGDAPLGPASRRAAGARATGMPFAREASDAEPGGLDLPDALAAGAVGAPVAAEAHAMPRADDAPTLGAEGASATGVAEQGSASVGTAEDAPLVAPPSPEELAESARLPAVEGPASLRLKSVRKSASPANGADD